MQNCKLNEQELSYHKQIARQLRIQYVKGICTPKYYTVTLKCRLRVIQGQGFVLYQLLYFFTARGFAKRDICSFR